MIVVLLAGCSGRGGAATEPTASTTTESPAAAAITTVDPTTVDQALADQLTAARTKAKEWQADALLHAVNVELPTDLGADGSAVTFVFGSPAAPNDWWTYSVNDATKRSIRATIPKTDYLGSALTPVSTQFWKMNYVQAFQLADGNGGAQVRAAHPDARVKLYLNHREPRQWLWWTVEYIGGDQVLLTLLVNPNRGEVVNTNGTNIAPETTP
jgi:hypothetical protein